MTKESGSCEVAIKIDRFQKIKNECFWDYAITPKEIEKIIAQGTKAEKKAIFSKIIYNSKDKLSDLMLFSRAELEEFFNDFQPSYNIKYISKHIAALKALLLDKKSYIRELEWREA